MIVVFGDRFPRSVLVHVTYLEILKVAAIAFPKTVGRNFFHSVYHYILSVPRSNVSILPLSNSLRRIKLIGTRYSVVGALDDMQESTLVVLFAHHFAMPPIL